MLTKEQIIGLFVLIIIVVFLVRDPNIKENFDARKVFQDKKLDERIDLVHKTDLNQTTEITQLPDSTRLKVAIVSMMRRPKDIDDWLEYHRAMGITRFYIRLEDSEELEEYLDGQPDITLEIGKSTGKDEYKEIQTRQCKMVDDALKKAQEDKMDWLFHIDADELLDGDIDELSRLSEKIRTVVMNNKEAVYKDIPRENDQCFTAVKFRDCSDANSGCVSYVNGKSGGRVAPDVTCFGPHRFRSNRADAEEKTLDMKILHFESCDFNTYKTKFKHVAKDPKSDIPFPYYNDSVAAAKKEDDKALEDVFRRYRVA
jgi:hypothetical protein